MVGVMFSAAGASHGEVPRRRPLLPASVRSGLRLPCLGLAAWCTVVLPALGAVNDPIPTRPAPVDRFSGLLGGPLLLLDVPVTLARFVARSLAAGGEDPGTQDAGAGTGRQTPAGSTAFHTAVAGRGAVPAPIVNGVAHVGIGNTEWEEASGTLTAFFDADTGPVSAIVRDDDSAVASKLNAWFRDGSAAGNSGDLYDNRDRGHSALPGGAFPQLARTAYAAEAVEAGVDLAMAWPVSFNLVTIGNASLAVTTEPLWRSLPRLLLTSPTGPEALFRQYSSNQIYVFPEHRDHDAEFGDLLTANTPYYIISQGSSGSDRPFLFAVASILAAFRPEVKSYLRDKGLIAPTVQWIFRRGQRGVDSEEDYLSGKAHPTVFAAENLDLEAMIDRAHGLTVDAVPPLVRIKAIAESTGRPGIDWFDPRPETVFDTPSAIARIFRSTAGEKRITLDAGETVDPNGRPLTFHWTAIGGDGVVISPRDDSGSIVDIVVPWQDRRPAGDWPAISSDRVDIAVFANNGENWSAPAFLSILFPGREKRLYRADGKIEAVDYDPPEFSDRYVDPVLFPLQRWRDSYRYDEGGELVGWTRAAGAERSDFTPDGARVLRRDGAGRPSLAARVTYRVLDNADGLPQLIETETGDVVEYDDDDED